MKIVLVVMLLFLCAGCATHQKLQQDYAKAIPCDKDNCGKLPHPWIE